MENYSTYLAMAALHTIGLAVLCVALLKVLVSVSKMTDSTARKFRHLRTSEYLLHAASLFFIACAVLSGVTNSLSLYSLAQLLNWIGAIVLLAWYLASLAVCSLFVVWDLRKKTSTFESIRLWGLVATAPVMIIRLAFQVSRKMDTGMVKTVPFPVYAGLSVAMEMLVVITNVSACYLTKRVTRKYSRCCVTIKACVGDLAADSLKDIPGNIGVGADMYWTTSIVDVEVMAQLRSSSIVLRRAALAKVAQLACLRIVIKPAHRTSIFRGPTVYCIDEEATEKAVLNYIVSQIPAEIQNNDEGIIVFLTVLSAIRTHRRIGLELAALEENENVRKQLTDMKIQLEKILRATGTTTTTSQGTGSSVVESKTTTSASATAQSTQDGLAIATRRIIEIEDNNEAATRGTVVQANARASVVRVRDSIAASRAANSLALSPSAVTRPNVSNIVSETASSMLAITECFPELELEALEYCCRALMLTATWLKCVLAEDPNKTPYHEGDVVKHINTSWRSAHNAYASSVACALECWQMVVESEDFFNLMDLVTCVFVHYCTVEFPDDRWGRLISVSTTVIGNRKFVMWWYGEFVGRPTPSWMKTPFLDQK